MTAFEDIYPQDILDLINNEDFNNTELKSPMIKPQQIADILGITYNEKLDTEFDADARQIKPHTTDSFTTNRRKDMRSIAYILLKTQTNYKNIRGDNWQTRINMHDIAASRLADKLLMPEKLIIRLIKEEMRPHWSIIKYTNPKTGVKKADVVQYKKEDYYILRRVAELLQVNNDVFKYHAKTLEIIH